MTEAKNDQGAQAKAKFQQEFDALPLEQKFSQLFKMEVATLNEAMRFVADSSMDVISKIGTALSDLGTTVETEAKKAAEPETASAGKAAGTSNGPKTRSKPSSSSAKTKAKGSTPR